MTLNPNPVKMAYSSISVPCHINSYTTHGMFSSSHIEKDLYHKDFNKTIVGLADQMIQAIDNK